MENKESFGIKLKRIRKQAGYSIVGLATQSGLNPQTIKDIEAGRSEAGIKSLIGLSKALNISIENLLGEVDVIPAKAPIKLSPRKLLKMYLNIPDDIVTNAEAFGPDHEVWDEVRATFEDALIDIKESKKKNKKA